MKKIITVFLSFFMILTMVGTNVFADDNAEKYTKSISVNWKEGYTPKAGDSVETANNNIVTSDDDNLNLNCTIVEILSDNSIQDVSTDTLVAGTTYALYGKLSIKDNSKYTFPRVKKTVNSVVNYVYDGNITVLGKTISNPCTYYFNGAMTMSLDSIYFDSNGNLYFDTSKMVTFTVGENTTTSNKVSAGTMYRLYNPNGGEHFYTCSLEEKDWLVSLGWNYEGEGFKAPTSGSPVYRLYHGTTGNDHLYTMDWNEVETLKKQGWNYEGIAWYSAATTGTPVYRLLNPNATTGTHHFTTSIKERDWLISLGWIDQGIGWYSE